MSSDRDFGLVIRRAREGEDVALTALVNRSVQQRWRYPDEFMAWHPEYIAIEPHHIHSMITYVLEVGGQAIGVYVLRGEPPVMELSRMMIDPEVIGHGYGRLLWNHASETARSLGVHRLTIDSDPNSEGFYQRMGAVTVGVHDESLPMMPGWQVKIMQYLIPPKSAS